MWKYIFQICILWIVIDQCHSTSSPVTPFMKYKHSVELIDSVADLWWAIDDVDQEITFELHMKTTGWIALGISPSNIFAKSL